MDSSCGKDRGNCCEDPGSNPRREKKKKSFVHKCCINSSIGHYRISMIVWALVMSTYHSMSFVSFVSLHSKLCHNVFLQSKKNG